MKRATFEEYQKEKEKTLYGKEYEVYTDLKNDVIMKTYSCHDGSAFYERMENRKMEFCSTDHSESRIYVEGWRNEKKSKTLEEQLEILTCSLNATIDLYHETKQENLKDVAIGYILLAQNLGIIDENTMIDILDAIKRW